MCVIPHCCKSWLVAVCKSQYAIVLILTGWPQGSGGVCESTYIGCVAAWLVVTSVWKHLYWLCGCLLCVTSVWKHLYCHVLKPVFPILQLHWIWSKLWYCVLLYELLLWQSRKDPFGTKMLKRTPAKPYWALSGQEAITERTQYSWFLPAFPAL